MLGRQVNHTTNDIDPQLRARLLEIASEFQAMCWTTAADEIRRMADNFPIVEHEAESQAWMLAEKAWAQHGLKAVNPYSETYQPLSAHVWRACIRELRARPA